MTSTDEQFSLAANFWDLDTLYADLASAKGKRLTPTEKLHLRGLLCGYSPAEIADKLGKNVKGVETDLCATLYKYVKSLVDKGSEKIENWRNITEWLEEAGYKTQSSAQSSAQSQLNNSLPVETLVKIANISIERNIVIDISVRLTAPLPSEFLKPDLDLDNNTTN